MVSLLEETFGSVSCLGDRSDITYDLTINIAILRHPKKLKASLYRNLYINLLENHLISRRSLNANCNMSTIAMQF